MKISVLSPVSRLPDWVKQGVNEYTKRLPRPWSLEWVDISLPKRTSSMTVERLKQAEGERILQKLPPHAILISLDVKGKRFSTPQMAQKLSKLSEEGLSLALAIGGPDGLSDQVLAASHERWSLSDLTMPHPLVRVVLAEQLYRCWSLLAGHPYHRE